MKIIFNDENFICFPILIFILIFRRFHSQSENFKDFEWDFISLLSESPFEIFFNIDSIVFPKRFPHIMIRVRQFTNFNSFKSSKFIFGKVKKFALLFIISNNTCFENTSIFMGSMADNFLKKGQLKVDTFSFDSVLISVFVAHFFVHNKLRIMHHWSLYTGL